MQWKNKVEEKTTFIKNYDYTKWDGMGISWRTADVVVIEELDSAGLSEGLIAIDAVADTVIRSSHSSITSEQAFMMVDEFEKMGVNSCRVNLCKEITVVFGDKRFHKFMSSLADKAKMLYKPIGDGWYIEDIGN